MKYLPFMLLFSVGLFTACNPIQQEVKRPDWPFQFVVVNNLDTNISRINLDTYISFPDEDYTNIIGVGKNIYASPSRDNYLNVSTSDSVIISPRNNVYTGCWYHIWVSVAKEYDIDNDGQVDGERFKQLLLHDTIRGPEDNILKVVWPRDSNLFKLRDR